MSRGEGSSAAVPRATHGVPATPVVRTSPVATIFVQRFPGDDRVVPAADRALSNVPARYLVRWARPSGAGVVLFENVMRTLADGGLNLLADECPAADAEENHDHDLRLFDDEHIALIPICWQHQHDLPEHPEDPAQYGATLLWLSERLHMLGYEAVVMDLDSTMLEQALLSFQWDYREAFTSMTVSGRLDSATIDALRTVTTPTPRAGR